MGVTKTKREQTPDQERASKNPNGIWCILASAGSGKTETFVQRIGNMVESGIKPYNILAVTFTKKASDEMRKRLEGIMSKADAEAITLGTFHSIAYRMLASYDVEFCQAKIAPDWWIMQKMNGLCKPNTEKNHLGLGLGIKAGELATFISYQKANLIGPDGPYVINDVTDFAKNVPTRLLREAYSTFERLREESRQVTFDDILVRFYHVLRDDMAFRTLINKKYHYVLIDEFQDTSKVMMEIVRLINTRNLFVVGDWRQSIYAFINANVENILKFPDEFPGTNLVELNKNFRSTQNIVNLSNQIIANSEIEDYKKYKPSESVSEVGDKIMFSAYWSEKAQAEGIARKMKVLAASGVMLSEMAVLVRTNSQSASFEEAFTDEDIPYVVAKSASFFERKEVLDLLSYARVASNVGDDASLRRIINTPNRYLSNQFAEELERYAGSKKLFLYDALRSTPQAREWKFRTGINSLVSAVESLQNHTNGNAGRFLRSVVDKTNYMAHVNENASTANVLADMNGSIDKLVEMASKFKNVHDFLGYIQAIQDKKKKKRKEAVNIVTMHSSKGLEWDAVFVTNVNQDLLPHTMNQNIEEERRLFYVATSRPKNKLYVSWYLFETEGGEVRAASPFINELVGDDTVDRMDNNVREGMQEDSCLIGL